MWKRICMPLYLNTFLAIMDDSAKKTSNIRNLNKIKRELPMEVSHVLDLVINCTGQPKTAITPELLEPLLKYAKFIYSYIKEFSRGLSEKDASDILQRYISSIGSKSRIPPHLVKNIIASQNKDFVQLSKSRNVKGLIEELVEIFEIILNVKVGASNFGETVRDIEIDTSTSVTAPASSQDVIQVQDVTPVAPVQVQDVSPQVQDVTPVAPVQVQDVTPVAPVQVQDVTPVAPVQVQDVSSVAPVQVQDVSSVAPVQVQDVTPVAPVQVQDVSPQVQDVSPQVQDVSPQVQDVTPVAPVQVQDVTPQVQDVTPVAPVQVQDVSPQVQDVTPQVQDVTPQVQDVTSVAPVQVQDVTPIAPVQVQDVSPQVQDVSPQVQDVTPIAPVQVQDVSPQVQDVSPQVQDVSPITDVVPDTSTTEPVLDETDSVPIPQSPAPEPEQDNVVQPTVPEDNTAQEDAVQDVQELPTEQALFSYPEQTETYDYDLNSVTDAQVQDDDSDTQNQDDNSIVDAQVQDDVQEQDDSIVDAQVQDDSLASSSVSSQDVVSVVDLSQNIPADLVVSLQERIRTSKIVIVLIQ
jgi:hypothetical protein